MSRQAVSRRHERKRLVQAAQLSVAGGSRRIHCIIRDISEGGARLRIPLGFETSSDIDLYIPDTAFERRARIVWREQHSIGIEFLTSSIVGTAT